MAVHVVGFMDSCRSRDGRILKVSSGARELLWAVYNTDEYKSLKPGDRKSTFPLDPDEYVDFVDPEPFNADLSLIQPNYYSNSTVTFHDELNDIYYPMFTADFMKMVYVSVLNRGRVSGRFGYIKKNVNFGIIYLGEKEENV